MPQRKFTIVLIKPSHYDDDGYVIQWRRSTIPSNSLASVYGLLTNARRSAFSAPTSISRWKSTTSATPSSTFRRLRSASSPIGGMVALVGVQSNQFPRALDIGREFREAGVTVAVGGFHVSGCIAMLPELPPDLKEAQALGIILYAGEGRRAARRFPARHPRRRARSRCTITSTTCRTWRRRRFPSCRARS